MIFEMMIERQNFMPQLQHIKQQCLDYFGPELYRVSIKPRGLIHGMF
jgi:hypothetical protein